MHFDNPKQVHNDNQNNKERVGVYPNYFTCGKVLFCDKITVAAITVVTCCHGTISNKLLGARFH